MFKTLFAIVCAVAQAQQYGACGTNVCGCDCGPGVLNTTVGIVVGSNGQPAPYPYFCGTMWVEASEVVCCANGEEIDGRYASCPPLPSLTPMPTQSVFTLQSLNGTSTPSPSFNITAVEPSVNGTYIVTYTTTATHSGTETETETETSTATSAYTPTALNTPYTIYVSNSTSPTPTPLVISRSPSRSSFVLQTSSNSTIVPGQNGTLTVTPVGVPTQNTTITGSESGTGTMSNTPSASQGPSASQAATLSRKSTQTRTQTPWSTRSRSHTADPTKSRTNTRSRSAPPTVSRTRRSTPSVTATNTGSIPPGCSQSSKPKANGRLRGAVPERD